MQPLIATNYEEEPSIYAPSILFSNDCFQYLAEQGSDKWHLLANAIKTNTTYKLDFYPSNGTNTITVDKNVVFSLAKYGDGRGGSMDFAIDKHLCLDAFIHAQDMTTKWLNK